MKLRAYVLLAMVVWSCVGTVALLIGTGRTIIDYVIGAIQGALTVVTFFLIADMRDR